MGKSEQQATIDIKDLPVGEEARYSAEFTPKEMGTNDICVFIRWMGRIGYRTESTHARKQ